MCFNDLTIHIRTYILSLIFASDNSYKISIRAKICKQIYSNIRNMHKTRETVYARKHEIKKLHIYDILYLHTYTWAGLGCVSIFVHYCNYFREGKQFKTEMFQHQSEMKVNMLNSKKLCIIYPVEELTWKMQGHLCWFEHNA